MKSGYCRRRAGLGAPQLEPPTMGEAPAASPSPECGGTGLPLHLQGPLSILGHTHLWEPSPPAGSAAAAGCDSPLTQAERLWPQLSAPPILVARLLEKPGHMLTHLPMPCNLCFCTAGGSGAGFRAWHPASSSAEVRVAILLPSFGSGPPHLQHCKISDVIV